MSARAAVVHARQDIGWSDFARLVTMARSSAEGGMTGHPLTKVGLRALQMDLEALATLVGDAIASAPGIEPDDRIIARLRAASERHGEGG